jgi:hypothetical protein
MDHNEAASSALHSTINRALHAMASHLHRFRSELDWLEDTIAWIRENMGTFHATEEAGLASLGYVATHLKSSNCFAMEVEKKIQNILALVSSTSGHRSTAIRLTGNSFSIASRLQMTS